MPTDDIIEFAKTNFRGKDRMFGIHRRDRAQHMYVVGQTGTGKTTLLKNLAVQDILSGQGLAVIDPHGEYVDELLDIIPPERANDVVYFNPYDIENPIGFNVLDIKNPDHKHLVASGLMAIFTKIWANVWSARMEYILNNAVLALLDTPGSTLLGIPRLLVDKEYRQDIIDNVTDPVVRSFWINEFETWQDRFRSEAIAPIQNKVGQFLSTNFMRNIVGQSKNSLDIDWLVNNRKILLVNVSKGRIGEDNSALLGAMLITKIQLVAMERVKLAMEQRSPFYLYVDEFQNFATDAFASMLSESRKYGLSLVISHQYIGQLISDTSTKVRDAIFGNVGTIITFRVGATDAEFLEQQFTPEVTMQDLVNLPNHCVYMKLMCDNVSSRPFSALTLPPTVVMKDQRVHEAVIQMSRKNYSRTRKDVENEIQRWSTTRVGGSSTVDYRAATPRTTERRTEEGPRMPHQPRNERFMVDLGEVGIGIGQDMSAPRPQARGGYSRGRRDAGPRRSASSGSPPQRSGERTKRPHPGPDITGLREALQDALGKQE